MKKIKLIGQILVVFCLLFANFIPILGIPIIAEYGAPSPNVTNIPWLINGSDDVSYSNNEFWTQEIQINSSGRMTWNNISAYTVGNISVQPNAYFNLTDCYLNLSGNLLIDGVVNFDNVTLVMNSTSDGEFGISVTNSGTFNVLNNSNISSMDKTTPIDIFTSTSGYESWGYHYNFTVYGNITINNSDVSYTYGNIIGYKGGIHLYETAIASITNSTIYENEICAIYAEGNSTHLIHSNNIYNVTQYGIYLYDHANAVVDSNVIETYLTNFGIGIVCEGWSHAKIYRNTIRNNLYDGIFLGNFSNASIQLNTISNNFRYGINVSAYLEINQGTGQIIYQSINSPFIYGNTIIDNRLNGIHDVCGPAEILNNTISHTTNGSGIFITNNQWDGNWGNAYSVPGNITNNTIQYNAHHGINLSANYRSTTTITMTLRNNTVTNNDRSGINVRGGTYQGTQYSPNPVIIQNNISYNNYSGVSNYRAIAYELSENYIQYNNDSGIYCEVASRPNIKNNYQISWNKMYGIETKSNSRPTIRNNSITNNEDNGISMDTSSTANQIYENIISDNLGHGLKITRAIPNIHDNTISFNNHSGVYLQGGTNVLSVKSNDITYNSWSGIEINTSGLKIQDNNVTNNSWDGIKITGGSPDITAKNLVNYNGMNGLACFGNAQPLITNSEFKNNALNGIYLDASSPRIGVSTVNNMVAYNTETGLVAVNGSSGILKGDFIYNTMDGVFTSGSSTNIEILDSDISNNGKNGFNISDNSKPIISNSTISGNTENAFWIDGSADPVVVNSTFANDSVWYEDTASTLTVKWHVFIKTVEKQNGVRVQNCKVWVNSTTQSQTVWTGMSNNNGWIEWLKITEYVEKDSNGNHRATEGGERTLWTSHDVSGDRRNFRETHITPNPVIDHTQVLVLRLDPNRAPNPVENIKPMSTHNAHPTISWDAPPIQDFDGHTVSYSLWVGTSINTSNIFESPLQTQTQYTLTQDLEYDNDGNKTYHVTIVSDDHHGGNRYIQQVLYLLNSKPSKPEITLSFSDTPSINLAFVRCTVTTPSIDPDGDQINYTYKWYRNDNEQVLLRELNTANTEDTISVNTDDIQFIKDDIWMVKVYASDGVKLKGVSPSTTAEFVIRNLGPQVTSNIEDVTLDEDTNLIDQIDLTTKFNDPDQNANTLDYSITVTDDKNLTVTMNTGTKKISINPASDWNGKTAVNITCSDNEGLWVTQWFTVTVNALNDEPMFKEIAGRPVSSSIFEFVGDEAAIEDQWYNFTIKATDIDIERGENDEISFELDSEVVTLNHDKPLEATLSFFPTNDDVGRFDFMISIKDKSMKGYKHPIVIKIEVKNTNDKPWLVSVQDYPSGKTYQVPTNRILDLSTRITFFENEKLTLLVTVNDPDVDDSLTFHADSVSIIEVDEDTDNALSAKYIITPDEHSIGLFAFNISIKDRKLEKDSMQIILDIKNINDKPTVKIISPSEVERRSDFTPGDKISFIAEVIDKDVQYGDVLSYTWKSDQEATPFGYSLVVDNSNLSIGEHLITFTAEDSFGESSSTIISIRVGGIDKDGDNLPDKWESLYFNSVNTYIGLNDPDKDGFTNAEEYELGSNPTDKDDPEKQAPAEKTDWGVIGAVAAMVIIILIVLVFLFMFLKKHKKKETDDNLAFGADGKPLIMSDDGVGPDGKGGMAQGTMGGQGMPMHYTAPQMMNCPKCSTVMTFSPSTGAFCINCGFRPENPK